MRKAWWMFAKVFLSFILSHLLCVCDAASISKELSGQLIIEHVPGIETEVAGGCGGEGGREGRVEGVSSLPCSRPLTFK